MGGSFLVLLIVLIWGPLVVISLVNVSNVSNPPVEISIQLTVRGFEVRPLQLNLTCVSQT